MPVLQEDMSKSRRQFLGGASVGLVATASACRKAAEKSGGPPAGAPPAFGTAPEVGPQVSPSTFAEAEKLVQVELSPTEREVAAGSWRRTLAPVYERRTGPRKLSLDPSTAPATRWDPVLPGQKAGPDRDRFIRSKADPGPLPTSDQDIAFAPLGPSSRAGSSRERSARSASPIYTWTGWNVSTPSSGASSP